MPHTPASTAPRPQGAANALLNGLAVLEAFSGLGGAPLSVTEIAEAVGLHKSTVSRMLTGLADAGYVERDPESARYRLGLAVIALAAPLLAELDVRRAALPVLEELTRTTGETSAIAVWSGSGAVVVEQVPSPHQVKHSAAIGTRYHQLANASVRVFLASFEASEADRLFAEGVVGGANEYRSIESIREQLAEIEQRGLAINDGDTKPEEFGVCAPVRDYRGRVVGSIIASAPRSRVQNNRSRPEIELAVLRAAAAVSARLGGDPTGDPARQE